MIGQQLPSHPFGYYPATNDAAPVCVPARVYAQLEATRDSGVANIITEIQPGLEFLGFEVALDWLIANPGQYSAGLMRGFAPDNPRAVPHIDRSALPKPEVGYLRPTRDDGETFNEQLVLNYVNDIRRLLPRADVYYNDGVWRETASLEDADYQAIREFATAIDYQPQQCYYNAFQTVLVFGDRYPVTYWEGYIMTEELGSPIEHAWVELEGRVLEATFPDGPTTAQGDAYLGVNYSQHALERKLDQDGRAEPLADDQPAAANPPA